MPKIRHLTAKLALLPTVTAMLVCFYGCIAWTIVVSFTRSSLFPNYSFVGLIQYQRLWHTARWHVAFGNMLLFGALFITAALAIGTVLAILLDQRVRFEGLFRTVFLYPLAMSFIVTGLAWQWFLNPEMGLQAFVRSLGWPGFAFDWIVRPDRAIYTVVIAAVWHAAGLVMAIMLAGMRGIDGEIWRAIRIEGIPRWRAYAGIVLPMLRPVVVTCVVLLAIDVVKGYDLIIALTKGGPGYATDLPAKFVIDTTFNRSNIALASAGAVVMLVSVMAVVAPYLSYEFRRSTR